MAKRPFDELPMTVFQWKVTLLSSMGMLMDGYVLTIFSALIMMPKWGLSSIFSPTSFEIGLMGSAPFVGMLVGSVIFGNLADRVGRKKIYTLDLSITALFLVLTAFSFNWLEFFILELLAGIGIGADYPISSSIQSEFSPRNKRGMLLVLNIFSWTIGSIIILLLAIPFYSLGPLDWRVMYASAAIIPIIVIFARSSLPETPDWLILKGDRSKAEESVRMIAKGAGETPEDAITSIHIEKGKTSIKSLFSKSYLTLTLFSTIAWFSYDFVSYGVWNFTPAVFSTTSSYAMSIIGTLLEEVPVFIGFIICIALVEKKGRRILEELGFLGAGVSLAAFAALAYFVPNITSYFALTFAAFAIMHIFHNVGPTNLTYAYPSEIYPTRLRGTGHGLATAFSRIGAIVGTISFAVVFITMKLPAVLIVIAVFEFLGFVVTYLWAPEVKGKKLS